MDDYSVPVLVDAKTEYTKHLTNFLISPLFEGIRSIYDQAKEVCQTNDEGEKILITFQDLLSDIPRWSQSMVEEEAHRILSNSCDWLEDLVTAVFISHTKILTAIRVGKKHKQINLKIPKIEHFIHRVYIDLAREFWKNPYLLNDEINKIEYQRNMRISEEIISVSITETIRKQLPVKHILKEYLGDSYDDEYEEDITYPDNGTHQEYIQQMAKKEGSSAAGEFNLLNDNDSNSVDNDQGTKVDVVETAASGDKKEADHIEATPTANQDTEGKNTPDSIVVPEVTETETSGKEKMDAKRPASSNTPQDSSIEKDEQQPMPAKESSDPTTEQSVNSSTPPASPTPRSETCENVKEIPLSSGSPMTRKLTNLETEKDNSAEGSDSKIVPLEKIPPPKAAVAVAPIQVIKKPESPKVSDSGPEAASSRLLVHDPLVVTDPVAALNETATSLPVSQPSLDPPIYPAITSTDLDKNKEISLDSLTSKLETVQLDYGSDLLDNGPEQIKQEVKQELSEQSKSGPANTINLSNTGDSRPSMSFFDDAIENDPDLLVNV